LSVIGLLLQGKGFEYGLIEGSFNSQVYIKFMDMAAHRAAQQFKQTGRITVVIQDNSSVHRSKLSQAQWSQWNKMGLWLFFTLLF
jgi:putative transposase